MNLANKVRICCKCIFFSIYKCKVSFKMSVRLIKTGFSEIRTVHSDWLMVLLINYDSKLITRTELQLQSKCHENNSTKAPVNYLESIHTNLNNFENVKLMGGN